MTNASPPAFHARRGTGSSGTVATFGASSRQTPGVETLWRKDLRVGDVITYAGCAFTAGDGVQIIHWLDADGTPLADDCELQPDDGRMWGSLPADAFLVRIGSCPA
jgi:hypothetical protein